MIRVIVSVILLVLLALLVSSNIGYTTSVDLLGIRFIENVSVVAVSALSFAFGIVYSLFIYFGSYRHSKAKRQLADKVRTMKERGKQLDVREAEKERTAISTVDEGTSPTTLPLV
ncbi:MAG: hypothetical protein CVV53_03340 [Spirochaetae bacterium HGW-Spirochaetae-9]|nr:MAG: hypothetical protein CVV53_03340 [Spirochaetae bacterium HGW-Spirochaetae-9]